jgi:hypothetical protein
VGYLPLARPDANMVFQLVARRYERGSILLTSNKAFGKAHRFRRTRARCCRNVTGLAVACLVDLGGGGLLYLEQPPDCF